MIYRNLKLTKRTECRQFADVEERVWWFPFVFKKITIFKNANTPLWRRLSDGTFTTGYGIEFLESANKALELANKAKEDFANEA